MNEQQYVQAYRRRQVETATPGQLIVMLYDAAIRNCRLAREALLQRDGEGASRHLLKAQDIVAELMSSLDLESGGELARNLLRLYDYVYRRLVDANIKRDDAAVREVEGLLSGLREAWAEVVSAGSVVMPERPAGPSA